MNRQPTNRERNANDVIDTVGFPDIPCENRARRVVSCRSPIPDRGRTPRFAIRAPFGFTHMKDPRLQIWDLAREMADDRTELPGTPVASGELVQACVGRRSGGSSPQGHRPPESSGMAARKQPSGARGLAVIDTAQSAATAAYRAAREGAPDLPLSLSAPAHALADLKPLPGPPPSRRTREKAAQHASWCSS